MATVVDPITGELVNVPHAIGGEVSPALATVDPSASTDGDKSWRSLQDTLSMFDVVALIARVFGS